MDHKTLFPVLEMGFLFWKLIITYFDNGQMVENGSYLSKPRQFGG